MKRIMFHIVLGFLLVFVFTPVVFAQGSESIPDADSSETSLVVRDTAELSDGYMTKDPGLAMAYAIVPGMGQVYTEQYWKIPIFLAPMGFFMGQAIYNHTRFLDLADQVDALDEDDPTRRTLKLQREAYRDNRDLNFAYYLGIHLLSVIDAYVGAHLFDFNVDDSLSSLYFYPSPEHSGIGIGYRW